MNNKLGISIDPPHINGNMELLRKELQRVENSGADCCELVLHGLDVVVGGRLNPARVNTVLALLRERKLEYTLHLPYELNLIDTDILEIYTNIFRAGIEFARMANMRVIVFHAGITRRDDKDAFRAEAERVRRLAKEADGIALCMENPVILSDDVFSAGKSAESMTAFCERVNAPNCKLTFDVGHYYLRRNGNRDELLEAIATAMPYIGHIHLHDNCGIALPMSERDYNHRIACGAADLHLPLGWGTIPVMEVITALSGYGGIVNLEIEKRFDDQYEASLELTRRCLSGANVSW
jgi:sugar phosphate isomerase/epimerase